MWLFLYPGARRAHNVRARERKGKRERGKGTTGKKKEKNRKTKKENGQKKKKAKKKNMAAAAAAARRCFAPLRGNRSLREGGASKNARLHRFLA